MNSVIDLHIHILPGVDDGSQDLETSLEMADIAYHSGVRHMAITPHSMKGVYDNFACEQLEDKYKSLRRRLKENGIGIQLYKGMEIFADEDLVKNLQEKKVWTINDTKYFLTEFDFGEDPEFMNDILYESQQAGYIPIVAHPERYYCVQDDPQLVYNWFCGGCGIQVNKGSILGHFGHREKETAIRLLKHGVVSIVGSDAHNTYSRSPSYTRLVQYLEEYFGEHYTDLVTHENPSRILRGKELVGYHPISFLQEQEKMNEDIF